MQPARTLWIDRGQVVPGLETNPFPDCQMPFRYYSLVEVTIKPTRTEIRWDPAYAHSVSLETVVDHLSRWPGPFVLRFFKQGWFAEKLSSAIQTAQRIAHIQSQSNVEPLRTSHVRNRPIGMTTLLPALRSAYVNPDAFRPYAVEDVVNDNDGTFDIARVGSHSMFRKYVCRLQDDGLNIVPGNEKWISEITPTYQEVLQSGKPKLDHVMARLTFTDDEPSWLTWHRLVQPMKQPDGRFGVRSFVVPAPVDISIV